MSFSSLFFAAIIYIFFSIISSSNHQTSINRNCADEFSVKTSNKTSQKLNFSWLHMDDNLTIKKIKNSWIKCKHRYFIHLKSTCQIKTFKDHHMIKFLSERIEAELSIRAEIRWYYWVIISYWIFKTKRKLRNRRWNEYEPLEICGQIQVLLLILVY